MRMHSDQFDTPLPVVVRLVAEQFPQWRGHHVHPVASTGTVNALFRLGEGIVLRFPLRPRDDDETRDSLLTEQDNARRIAAHARLPVPEPLGLGTPTADYPGWWTAYRWIPGEPATEHDISDHVAFARDLAGFVRDVAAMDTGGRGWDGRYRGGPLAGMAEAVERALAQSTRLVDVTAVARVWQQSLQATVHPGPDVWLHADLMPGNLLVRDGRLAAVIDLGTVCIGDPAVDLMPAWNLLTRDGRAAYRESVGCDDATWERGRGWAIAQAIMALPYYLDTNPAMAATARRTLAAVLE